MYAYILCCNRRTKQKPVTIYPSFYSAVLYVRELGGISSEIYWFSNVLELGKWHVYMCAYCAWASKHSTDNELQRNVRANFWSGDLPATTREFACVVFIHPYTFYSFDSLHGCVCVCVCVVLFLFYLNMPFTQFSRWQCSNKILYACSLRFGACHMRIFVCERECTICLSLCMVDKRTFSPLAPCFVRQ